MIIISENINKEKGIVLSNFVDSEEQGSDDENDLLVRFGSLGKQLKTFQRDLTRADKRVESAKKVSSPLRKKRKKQR